MQLVLGGINSIILLILSGLHFYWVFGGKWGFEQALPTDEEGKKVLNPTKLASAIVGLGLFMFACYYLFKTGFIPVELPEWASTYGGWAIAAVFMLRAIGEFKFVGFFKRIRNTDFGKLDTTYYAPLCLMIGGIGIMFEVLIMGI